MNLDWCAGFFDGEGTVGLWKNRAGRASSKARRLTASVGQNVREPLDVFARVTGLGKVRGPYRNSNGGNTSYQWSVAGQDVVELMYLLYDRLVLKRGQFEDAVRQYKTYKATVVRGRPKTRGISK